MMSYFKMMLVLTLVKPEKIVVVEIYLKKN